MSKSETGRADHACDACGGSGIIETHVELTGYIRPAGMGNPTQCRATACPVCLGSGRISDVMPESDAMSDFQTHAAIVSDFQT